MEQKENSRKQKMKSMVKILIVFYSRDGHTRKSTEIIANVLNADIDEIVDKKSTGEGTNPWGVVVNELTKRVYVSNEGTAEVVVFDTETMDELARISVDNDPNDGIAAHPGRMAILPELDLVFVTVRGENRIAIIE